MKLHLLLIAALGAATLALPTASSASAPTIGGCSVFPSDHVWNTPIDTLPLDSSSTTYVNTIGASTGLKADFGAGLWDGGPIGIPFVTVPGSQPKYPVTFDYADESDPGPYAVPLDASIEGGSQSSGDRHAISVDTTNCILYELYSAFPGSNSWDAGSGAIYDLKGYALRPAGWTSADAAGLPIVPGLVRYDEIAAGEITHAIRFTVPQTRNTYVWPARHKASSLTGAQYPPMGERFRLKASFDISGFSAANQVILKALKKYGMILADNGSAWYMSGAPDERWNNSDLQKLHTIVGSNFEAVNESSLMIDPNSGKAKQSTASVSVTVSPNSGNVLPSGTKLFTATVTGSTNQAVTWLVNGIAGGNTTVGTVSSGGLYTAPAAIPSPNTVNVQARSSVDSNQTGSAAVTISMLPTLSSFSPSSFPAGSFTLTVNGTGFQNGAVVKLGSTALTTTWNSSTKLTATGTASAGQNIPVSVTNPDGGVSNFLSVTVMSAPTNVSVTISPTSASVRLRRTKQFTATVANATNKSVTWKVNGITGGNATVGTVSSSGLYTAPSDLPSNRTITVSATSVQSPTKSASASVTITRR